MSRRSGRVETVEFAAFTRRIIRAYVRRAEEEEMDPADLADLAEIAGQLEDVIRTVARRLHETGFSWSEIGSALGTTKQTAHERFASGRT